MEIWQCIILTLVGFVAGFVNVMAGGGSLLSIPVMLFMGLPGPVANGTNRIAVLAQTLTAVVAFFRRRYSDFRLSATLALAALPGAVIGAYAGVHLEGVWFNRALAVIMIIVMLLMCLKKALTTAEQGLSPGPRRLFLAHGLIALVGFYGGCIQVGVGFLFIPVLSRTLGLDLVRVNMHKSFIIGTYTLAALIVFASQIEIFWVLGASLALGNALGAWLSAQVQVNRGERVIRWVLHGVLLIFIIKLLFFS